MTGQEPKQATARARQQLRGRDCRHRRRLPRLRRDAALAPRSSGMDAEHRLCEDELPGYGPSTAGAFVLPMVYFCATYGLRCTSGVRRRATVALLADVVRQLAKGIFKNCRYLKIPINRIIIPRQNTKTTFPLAAPAVLSMPVPPLPRPIWSQTPLFHPPLLFNLGRLQISLASARPHPLHSPP